MKFEGFIKDIPIYSSPDCPPDTLYMMNNKSTSGIPLIFLKKGDEVHIRQVGNKKPTFIETITEDSIVISRAELEEILKSK